MTELFNKESVINISHYLPKFNKKENLLLNVYSNDRQNYLLY